MKTSRNAEPLRVSVLGLDTRTENLFRMFFQGPCQNSAEIVAYESSEVTLIDLDVPTGKSLFEDFRAKNPQRVVILLSISEPTDLPSHVIFVKKPAQAQSMMKAIEDTRRLVVLAKNLSKAALQDDGDDFRNTKVISAPESLRATPRRAATLMDEKSFGSYLGFRDDVDPADPKQVITAIYSPRDFLQGHIVAAWEMACNQDQPMRLHTSWRSVYLLPKQGLIHIQADEPQLRAACSIPFRNIAGIDMDLGEKQSQSNVCTMTTEEADALLAAGNMLPAESFLWKIALLTSKGRLPDWVHPLQPVRLKHWPNMTRLLLPPHAMRIASLLVQKAVTPFEAACNLKIRQQFVFAFISASHVLGLIEQNENLRSAPSKSTPVIPERVSILKRIINRLKVF